MKKLFLLPLISIFFFASCGSTQVEPQQEKKPEPKVETVEEEVIEPEVKAEVAPVFKEEPKVEVSVNANVDFEYNTYKVKKGEDYHKISEKLYKNRHLWACLYSANKENFSNPDLIEVGATIKVPTEISVSDNSKNVKDSLKQAYEAYENQIASKKSSAKVSRTRAIGVLVSGELLYPGYIEDNSSSIQDSHAKEAVKILNKKYPNRNR